MKNTAILFGLLFIGLGFASCAQNPENGTSSNKNSPQVDSTSQGGGAKGDSPSNSQENPQPVDANKVQAAGVPGTAPEALLNGTYATTEVQHDGIIDLIKPDNQTEIVFKPPATYTRSSKKNGKMDHTDSGYYSISGDTLILKIVMSQQQIQTTPVEKRFKFKLSTDGSELKLESDKSKIAVFRRIKE
ncbi:MAG: hypothetical protein AB1757_19655 [Acidobacteriota bacterium]